MVTLQFIVYCDVRIRSEETVEGRTSSMIDFKLLVSTFMGYKLQFLLLSMVIDSKSDAKIERERPFGVSYNTRCSSGNY